MILPFTQYFYKATNLEISLLRYENDPIYRNLKANRNMKYQLMGWFQLFSLLNLDFDLDTRF